MRTQNARIRLEAERDPGAPALTGDGEPYDGPASEFLASALGVSAVPPVYLSWMDQRAPDPITMTAATNAAAEPEAAVSAPSWFARLHARLEAWADAGWSNSVVFGWGLLQGCVFPGLADLFFLPLALARPARAYVLALVATAGTLIGSIALYWAGRLALDVLLGPFSQFFDLSPASLTAYRATLAHWGGWAIFASTMSPLSTKLTSIASGIAGVPFLEFVLALAAGRLTRTFVFAWLVRHGGAQAVARWTGRPAT